MTSQGYAVLISEEGHLRPADIARALAAARKIPFQDAIQSAHKCWGIVEEGVSKEAAEADAHALNQAGLKALAIPAGLLEDVPAARSIKRMDFSPAGLFPGPESEQGQAQRVAWERLALIAAAGYRETEVWKAPPGEGSDPAKKMLKMSITLLTGMPTSLGLGQKPAEKKAEVSDFVFILDMVFKEPPERLRIEAGRFDFSCLKERMLCGGLGNFKLLSAELAKAAPKALLSRGAKVLLENRPVREMGYDGPADLERESRWLLTLKALKP
ncbi:MAG: hypothetical protein HY922_14840 [Elusimicrobia bacterium]|nr:hypothetical protein [Elusimicrobiota bacterium]